jgi:predicted lipoprotein with Yx(FWY)xxD motif
MLTHHLPRAARLAAVFGLIATSFASAAFASPSVTVTSSASGGQILTDASGMTLYRYTPDQPGVSTCYDSCAVAWPPVLVDSVPSVADAGLAGNLGLAARNDGTQQLTYQGSPLYYYVGDRQSGQTTGDGSDGVWFVIHTGAS